MNCCKKYTPGHDIPVREHPVDMGAVLMKFVVRPLEMNIDKDQQGCSYSDGQPKNVDGREQFPFQQASSGRYKVVVKHLSVGWMCLI